MIMSFEKADGIFIAIGFICIASNRHPVHCLWQLHIDSRGDDDGGDGGGDGDSDSDDNDDETCEGMTRLASGESVTHPGPTLH